MEKVLTKGGRNKKTTLNPEQWIRMAAQLTTAIPRH